MATVQVTSEVNIELDKVLDGVAKLDTLELEQFLSQVSILLARRKAPSLPEREAELLQEINQSLPTVYQQRYDELAAKLQANDITPEEYQELLQLIDQIELADAERVQCLIELAQLRNLSLDELMNQLNIHHPPAHA
ncbi:MAG: STAS/SEC14 domain-containing protein [Chloroflexi bacterium]|nr:STAS/SEC14 domain-containing protein [Chloroflexota bacterium]